MADETPEVATFKARGAGGSEWEFDVPAPGSPAEDRFVAQIRKGELEILGDNPFEDALVAAEPNTGPVVPALAPGTGPYTEPVPPPGPFVGPAPTEPASTPDAAAVPDGTVDDVLSWIDGAPDSEEHERRVHAALDAEQAKDSPRSTLVEQLEKLVDQE